MLGASALLWVSSARSRVFLDIYDHRAFEMQTVIGHTATGSMRREEGK